MNARGMRRIVAPFAVFALFTIDVASAADVRMTSVDLSFLERDGGGWVPADAPAIGAMVTIRCDYAVEASAEDGRPPQWSLAFMLGDEELGRAAGAGLVDPETGRSSRTWYGTLLAGGAHEVGCVADVDGELAETDETNNRLTRTLDVPSPARMRTQPPVRATVFGTVTPLHAARARGGAPSLDLTFTEFAGIKPATDRLGPGTLETAVVGEPLAINCSYRAYIDGPNGEPVQVPEWSVVIERDGAPANESAGRRDLVSMDGASTPGYVVERWIPSEPGDYLFRCRLDPGNAVAETDNTNNVLELAIEVVADGMPRAARETSASNAQREHPAASSAQLAFTAIRPGTLELVKGPGEITVYRTGLKVGLIWESPHAKAFQWRWQAALWPFPSDPAQAPQALLADGVASAPTFIVNLGGFPPLGEAPKSATRRAGEAAAGNVIAPAGPAGRAAPSRAAPATPMRPAPAGTRPPSGDLPPAIDATPTPAQAQAGNAAGASAGLPAGGVSAPDAAMDFYLRLVPFEGGKPAGPPSNFVVVHYVPGENPMLQEIEDAFAARAERQKKLAEMSAAAKVYTLDLVAFEKAIFPEPGRWGCVVIVTNPHHGGLPPFGGYAPGKTYCPQKDPSTQQKGWDEKLVEGLEGFGKAWNGLAWAYDQAKDWVAEQFAETLVPCAWLGEDLESDCKSAAKTVAGTAISVGLTAAGVPPTLPDLEAMGAIAKGEAAEGAVGYTCDIVEANGGECTPAMRDALAKIYEAGLNELQMSVKQQAHEPHCGDAQTAKELGLLPLPCFTDFGVEVKAAPGAVETAPAAQVRVRRTAPDPDFPMDCRLSVSFELHNDVEGYGPVSDYLWPNANADVPPLGVGQSTVVHVGFPPRQVGKQGPFVDWVRLLKGATGELSVWTNTGQAVAPGDQGPVTPNCSDSLGRTVSIPYQLDLGAQWVLQ